MQGTEFQVGEGFSLNILNNSLHSLLSCLVSEMKTDVVPTLVLLLVQHPPSLASFRTLSSIFYSFQGGTPWCSFLAFIQLDVLYVSSICGLMFNINMGTFSILIFQIFLLFLFFSPFGILITYTLFLLQLSHRLRIFCFFLFSLHFSVLEISIETSSRTEVLSSEMTSLRSPSKAFYIFATVLFISSTFFQFFLRISFSLYCPAVLACCLL